MGDGLSTKKPWFISGLWNPSEEHERLLFGFNRLRNSIAHDFQDEAACVENCLPWELEEPRPDAMKQVFLAAVRLFFDLGIIDEMRTLRNIDWSRFDDRERDEIHAIHVEESDDGTVTTTVTMVGESAKPGDTGDDTNKAG